MSYPDHCPPLFGHTQTILHWPALYNFDLTHLIKIEHQVQLTNIPEKAIKDLDEKVYSLQVCQLVIIRVDASAEEEAGVATVDNTVIAELDEVGLVFLVAGCYETMYL